ncbi:MAG: sigma-70 family RNA polymerase sigma factor [Candidatus Aminicenantes bacterium]|nr:sigma-70 family RNA polymerase sigma factor [Candidatus Aminicenantes bacterium]
MDDLSEAQLLQLAAQKNVDVFTELARRYQGRIYNLILGMTKNPCDADDLAQETFMMAFKSIRRFKQDSSFYTWLYRIAVNQTLNYFKKSKREKRKAEAVISDISREKSSQKTVSNPEKSSLKEELRDRIDAAIHSLPDPFKAAFFLVEYEEMSHKKAASVLKCSENTVSWRMHKARKMLQSKLGPYLKGESHEL